MDEIKLRTKARWSGRTHEEFLIQQGVLEKEAQAIAHDLRLAHQMAARLAALEPVVEKAREWFRQHYAVDEMEPTTKEDVAAADTALAAALDALGAAEAHTEKEASDVQ